ncbi:MAG: hypothetical protein O6940_13300, partial [Ignavibacteria bacterium]|nr:hypothetical protein [Ignavibacteria bacterium]
MKNLFLTCMVLILVFIFGCQESSITDPVQPLTKDETGVVNRNLIGLKYQLADPFSRTAYMLTGQVKYENTITPSIDDVRKVWVKVRLEMTSQLYPLRGSNIPLWKIEEKTEDKVFFTTTGSAAKRLYKTYSITNRGDIELGVTYLITLKSVKVVEVFLIGIGV